MIRKARDVLKRRLRQPIASTRVLIRAALHRFAFRSPTASRLDEGMSLRVRWLRGNALTLVLKQEIDMTMKNTLTIVAAVAAAMFAQASFAQASAPAARADVKAETKAAAKEHKLTPAGEGAAPVEKSTAKSTKTRDERKAETQAARKEKKLTPAGEASPAAAPSTGPTAARADVKAETKAAVKAGTTIKAGEGPDAPKK
ncbi:MAG: hypothetical protein V4569_04560 [Pseudomonadota bacterium]